MIFFNKLQCLFQDFFCYYTPPDGFCHACQATSPPQTWTHPSAKEICSSLFTTLESLLTARASHGPTTPTTIGKPATWTSQGPLTSMMAGKQWPSIPWLPHASNLPLIHFPNGFFPRQHRQTPTKHAPWESPRFTLVCSDLDRISPHQQHDFPQSGDRPQTTPLFQIGSRQAGDTSACRPQGTVSLYSLSLIKW